MFNSFECNAIVNICGQVMELRTTKTMQQSQGLAAQQEGLLITLYGRKTKVDLNNF